MKKKKKQTKLQKYLTDLFFRNWKTKSFQFIVPCECNEENKYTYTQTSETASKMNFRYGSEKNIYFF